MLSMLVRQLVAIDVTFNVPKAEHGIKLSVELNLWRLVRYKALVF